jgi:hypothetical protein
MERQPRNIVGLATLFIAALGSVALLGAEHSRSTINTVILAVAAGAAAGSLLALVIGPVAFSVFKRDVRRWWDGTPHRRWLVRHYPAREPEANVVDLDVHPSEPAIRAEGMPCVVMGVRPRKFGTILERPLKDVAVSCTVERRDRRTSSADAIEVKALSDDAWGAIARWPDQWFDLGGEGPSPGHYRVRWHLRRPDGRIERPSENVHVVSGGKAEVGQLARALSALRAFVRHYHGLD